MLSATLRTAEIDFWTPEHQNGSFRVGPGQTHPPREGALTNPNFFSVANTDGSDSRQDVGPSFMLTETD